MKIINNNKKYCYLIINNTNFPEELWIEILYLTKINPIKFLTINLYTYYLKDILLKNYYRNHTNLDKIMAYSFMKENKLLYSFFKKNVPCFRNIALCNGRYKKCSIFVYYSGKHNSYNQYYFNNNVKKYLKKMFVWDYSIDRNPKYGNYCCSCWYDIMGVD